eukprot:m.86424 g.86424  ORF g.86424 m.86424 type:complete len:208 (-) comp13550_c0_seq2:579-1202(-)
MAAPPQEMFLQAYTEKEKAPWEISQPQPALEKLVEKEPALIRGRVLDMCCGIGLNTALVAGVPGVSSVLGIDFNSVAIERAKAHAQARGAAKAQFQVVSVLEPATSGLEKHSFDVIIDSASYHCFSLEDRSKYVAALEYFARPGCLLVMLCFSPLDVDRPFPRRISEEELRQVFSESNGWSIRKLERAWYRDNFVGRDSWLAQIVRL